MIGIVAGSIAASFAGLYQTELVRDAHWVGIPGEPPELRFDFGPSFLQLLPAFVLVFLVCTVRTVSGALAIQGVSWRQRRAADFRAVQGAVAADAASNFVAGIAGTVPNGARVTTVALTASSSTQADAGYEDCHNPAAPTGMSTNATVRKRHRSTESSRLTTPGFSPDSKPKAERHRSQRRS